MEWQASLDTPLLRGKRKRLVQLLKEKGIHDERILQAFAKIPRHFFVPPGLWEKAYEDIALPIEYEQTISQPFTVAYQTMLLDPQPNLKVLEIGTGSGYQCAILCELGMEVYSIERIPELAEKARERLAQLGYFPHIEVGDGTLGLPKWAPYDRILVTAAAPHPPKPLLEHLANQGIMVIPIGDRKLQKMWRIRRENDHFIPEAHLSFRFVPLIGKEGWK